MKTNHKQRNKTKHITRKTRTANQEPHKNKINYKEKTKHMK